jgi:hypothetical protein
MKYVLVKFKSIKLLINEECNRALLFAHLTEIESLGKKLDYTELQFEDLLRYWGGSVYDSTNKQA